MMDGIYLLLGTNLNDKKKNLITAEKAIELSVGKIVQHSSIYETAAWGKTDQPSFLNKVIKVATNLGPTALLTIINKIEAEMGRVRHKKWGERLIDIDILYYNDVRLQTKRLVVPHPGIPERRFTLAPLNEIAPHFIHPKLGKTNKELLEICEDGLAVEILLA